MGFSLLLLEKEYNEITNIEMINTAIDVFFILK